MSDFNKIPFGLRQSDNEFVDVHDVPNGQKCGCVCPSCRTQLQAKQGGDKVWHFAHSSKKVYENTKNECEYSFYLSLRLMARQLIGKQLKLCLPEYKGVIEYYEGIIRIPQTKEFIVTGQKEITLYDIEIESNFYGSSVDVIGSIGDFKFIIYFTHPDRAIPEELFNPENTKCGVIEISLLSLQGKFMTAKDDDTTYHKILSDFLVNDTDSKSWVYHPNFKRYYKTEIEKIKSNSSAFRCSKISQNNHNHFIDDNPIKTELFNNYRHSDTPALSFNHTEGRKDKEIDDFLEDHMKNLNTQLSISEKKFSCVICKSQWAGTAICPECNTHLYSTKITD